MNGYEVKRWDFPTKRYCQTLKLKEQPELIAAYRRAHSREEAWPEILAGIRQVGILEMEIYLHGSTLVMIVETEAAFDWDAAMSQLATLPRQAEWEDHVAAFQECAMGATSAGKWKMMDRIFHLYD